MNRVPEPLNSFHAFGTEGPASFRDADFSLMHGLENVLFGYRAKRSVLTKSEWAYAAVRRAIVTHTLPSSVPLDESFLLDHFPVGRTPLREALKRLSYEGLLVWAPHQAPMIGEIGLYDLQHLYETRRILEFQIATISAERASPEDIIQMDTVRRKLADASHAGHVYEAVELDFALHSAIAHATQNRFLVEASNNLSLQSLRLWFRAQHVLGVATIDKSHNDLVRAISRHDPRETLLLTKAHIDSSLERQQMLLTRNASTYPVSDV